MTLRGISDGSLLSTPAAPGPIKLIVGRDGHVRVRVPPVRRAAALTAAGVQFTHDLSHEHNLLYCPFATTPSVWS